MDMGVGRGGLVKLCRHLDKNVMNSTTYSSHVKELIYANKVAVTTILDEAVTVIRQTHYGHAHRGRRRHRLGCQLRWQFDDERTQGIVWDWVCGGYHHWPMGLGVWWISSLALYWTLLFYLYTVTDYESALVVIIDK